MCLIFCLPLVSSQGLAQPVRNYEQARALERAGSYGDAFLEYRQNVQSHPLHKPSILGLLRTSIFTENWQNAEESLQRFESLTTDSDSAALWGSRLYYKQQKYDTALRWANRLRKRAPGSWRPYHFKFRIFFEQNQFTNAKEAIESAQLRSQQNQWVLLDELLLKKKADDVFDTNLFNTVLRVASNPTVHWNVARRAGTKWSRSRLIKVLERGGKYLPAERPPLKESIEETQYRYWWSRFLYEADRIQQARRVIEGENGSIRIQWLKSNLKKSPNKRLRNQLDVLQSDPDHPIRQWQLSELARKLESLDGSARTWGSDYFKKLFENANYLGLNEGVFGLLIRSLELNPLQADRQFQFARYLHDRGWRSSERDVLRRVRELGLSSQDRILDYLEGLGTPDTMSMPVSPTADLAVKARVTSPWEGPLAGSDVLESIIRQNLYHQPAFAPVQLTDESIADAQRTDRVDGGVRLIVSEWNESLVGEMDIFYPNRDVNQKQFLQEGNLKVWGVNEITLGTLKENWPWNGQIFDFENSDGWVNIGAVHGMNAGDTLILDMNSPPVDETVYEIEEVRENRSKISFPSPYYGTQIRRGSPVARFD